MTPPSTFSGLLHRLGLATLGLVLILFGAGVLTLAFGSADAFRVGTLIGLVLIAAGGRQVYAAVIGVIPKWYTELVLFGGVIGSGGPRIHK